MSETKGETVAAMLRRPFKPEEIGKLPRVTCPKCSDKDVRCDEHRKTKCGECNAYVSERHIHIDYVGHADITSRLLEADPGWNWEPLASDDRGLPVFDTDQRGNAVGLWIRLTAGGMTRLGYGSVPSGQNDAVKVLIGDALRNAAMRFGVALDLWAKGDRADPAAENATASAGKADRSKRQSAADAFDNAKPAKPQQRPEVDESAVADWDVKIKGIASRDDGTATLAELKTVFAAGRMNAITANTIRGAIGDKVKSLENATREMAGASQ